MTSDITQAVQKIVQKLEEFNVILQKVDYTHEREDFFSTINGLDEYITSIEDRNIFNKFYHSKHFFKFQKRFLYPHQYYMRAIEAQESSFIQRTTFRNTNSPLEDTTKGEFMKTRFHSKVNDLKMIEFEKVKKVVMVGSGSLPDTILFLAENFKIPEIIGLDNNAEAVFSSCELINFLGFSNITIKNVDGLHYDYSDADLVYIANFVPPKNEVLNQIAKTAPQHVQIIIESPILMGQLFFEEVIPEKLNPILNITKESENKTKYFWHKVLKIEKYPDF